MENEGINYSDYFVVDPESPTGLRWRDDVVRMYTSKQSGTSVAGQPAGVKRIIEGRSDSIVVLLRGKIYIVSRVIWEMVNGTIPEGYIIDHLDGDALNNKIENLACKTRGENMQNRKLDKRNNTGVPGVVFNGWAYIARYQNVEKKSKTKAFPIKTYGKEEAFRLACEWRLSMLQMMNSEFNYKYTDRHFTGGV